MRAPVAMRMPISRVRSVTLTSMMFITPMPPTSSEIAAIEPSSIVSVFCVSVAVSRSEAMLRIWKSTVRWRAVQQRVDRACVSSICVDVVDRHRDVAQEALAEQAQAAGRVAARTRRRPGRCPCGDAPRAPCTPITWNSTLLSTTYWPIGSAPSGNRSVGDGLAEHDDRRVALARRRARRTMPRATGQLRAIGKVGAGRRGLRLVVGVAEARGDAAAELAARRRATFGSAAIASASSGISVAMLPPMPRAVRRAGPDQQQVRAHAR